MWVIAHFRGFCLSLFFWLLLVLIHHLISCFLVFLSWFVCFSVLAIVERDMIDLITLSFMVDTNINCDLNTNYLCDGLEASEYLRRLERGRKT